MVRDEETKYHRLGLRYGQSIAVIIFILFLVFGTYPLLAFLFMDVPYRTTVVIAGSPMTIASWDGERKHLDLIELPENTVITGVHGVGNYSLEALWKLGDLDAPSKGLLSESLSDSLGILIPYYIGRGKGRNQLEQGAGPSLVKNMFALKNIFSVMAGQYRTTIPLRLFLSLAWSLKHLRPDAIAVLSARNGMLTEKELPDGSRVSVLDPDRSDSLLKDMFEDGLVRKEALHLAVLNTTNTAALGKKIERLLIHAGAFVVSVDNASPVVDRCVLVGAEKKLESITARFLTTYFQCSHQITEESERADITVKIGRLFEKQFYPSGATLP